MVAQGAAHAYFIMIVQHKADASNLIIASHYQQTHCFDVHVTKC